MTNTTKSEYTSSHQCRGERAVNRRRRREIGRCLHDADAPAACVNVALRSGGVQNLISNKGTQVNAQKLLSGQCEHASPLLFYLFMVYLTADLEFQVFST